MAYYSRHSIFLYDNDKQKLLYLQTLIEEEELSFELREETILSLDITFSNFIARTIELMGLLYHLVIRVETTIIFPIEPKPNRYSMTICWRYERQVN